MSFAILCAAMAGLGWMFLHYTTKPEPSDPTCSQCGSPTIHHCGMGACVERCPKCDRL